VPVKARKVDTQDKYVIPKYKRTNDEVLPPYEVQNLDSIKLRMPKEPIFDYQLKECPKV
jgi:hypothetical protein